MKNKELLWQLPFLTFLIVGTIIIIRQQQDIPYQSNSGLIFGTAYNITYQSDTDLRSEIVAELQKNVDQEFSMFNEQSTVSRINRGEDPTLSPAFVEVLKWAMQISRETDGAFDVTVAPLVNAWGFGFKNEQMPTQRQVDSLRHFIGFEKMTVLPNEDHPVRIQRADSRMMLDFSAIAKGYGSMVAARVLKSHGIKNYMVEIGGEIETSGVSPKRIPWKIGVTKPTEDSLSIGGEIQTILNVTDIAMATSGNYRNFYYKNGRRYAHTIDPKTGYPVQHNILSATVLTKGCAIADAYATAFMVMGFERAKEVLNRHPELMAYFIYSDQNGNYAVWFSPSLRNKIEQ